MKRERYTFNIRLFVELPALLGVSQQRIADSMGMTRGTWQHTQLHGDCMMRNLTKVCNEFRIDIRKFFIKDGGQAIPDKLVTDKSEWEELDYHPEDMRNLWHNRTSAVVRREEVMSVLGIEGGRTTILRLTSENSPMRASQWAKIISAFDVDFYTLWRRKKKTYSTEDESRRILERRIEEVEANIRAQLDELERLKAELYR